MTDFRSNQKKKKEKEEERNIRGLQEVKYRRVIVKEMKRFR